MLLYHNIAMCYNKNMPITNKQKTGVTLGGLVVVAGVVIASVTSVKSQNLNRKKKEALKEVRAFFGKIAKIATIYIYEEDATYDFLSGGVVMEDGTSYTFVNRNGMITYQEEISVQDGK